MKLLTHRFFGRMKNGTVSDQAGFTLMETALALLVIGLAFLTLMGLGRSGLESVRDSNNDTRSAVMAEAVFETLRNYNRLFHEQSMNGTNYMTWAQIWQKALTEENYFPFPPVAGMSDSDTLYLKFNTLAQAYDPENITLKNWHPRYFLQLGFTDNSRVAHDLNMITVGLTVYPDGDTYSSEERFFSTVLTSEGGL